MTTALKSSVTEPLIYQVNSWDTNTLNMKVSNLIKPIASPNREQTCETNEQVILKTLTLSERSAHVSFKMVVKRQGSQQVSHWNLQ